VWLVDLPNRPFFVHRSPTLTESQDVQSLTALSAVTPLLLSDVAVDLSRLF
jgi:hypothetical protein